jgi:hypothetical protein
MAPASISAKTSAVRTPAAAAISRAVKTAGETICPTGVIVVMSVSDRTLAPPTAFPGRPACGLSRVRGKSLAEATHGIPIRISAFFEVSFAGGL